MPPRMANPAERFWPKVDKSGECWVWTGYRNPSGYGELHRGRRGTGMVRAHRFSWELANGPIPRGLCVLHRCDNPPCVNPDHLWLGTKADNQRDMASKGRGTKTGLPGESNPNARLTRVEIHAIRSASGESGNWLATKYGVTRNHIYTIRARRNWRTA